MHTLLNSVMLIGALSTLGFHNGTALLDEYRPLLNEISNPSEYQVASTCGNNTECRVGLLNDARQLRMALAMYDDSMASYAQVTAAHAQAKSQVNLEK